jgi:hypothetical protein
MALVAILPKSQNDELLKAIFEPKRTPVIIDNVKFLRQTIDSAVILNFPIMSRNYRVFIYLLAYTSLASPPFPFSLPARYYRVF